VPELLTDEHAMMRIAAWDRVRAADRCLTELTRLRADYDDARRRVPRRLLLRIGHASDRFRNALQAARLLDERRPARRA
jgi:hypothetical protein